MTREFEAYEREVFEVAQKLCADYLQTGECTVHYCKNFKRRGFIYGCFYFVLAIIAFLGVHFFIAEGDFLIFSLIIPFFMVLAGILIIFNHRAKIKEMKVTQYNLIFRGKYKEYMHFDLNSVELLQRIHHNGSRSTVRYDTIDVNYIRVDKKKYRLIFQTRDIDALILIVENKWHYRLGEFSQMGFEEWATAKNEDGSVLPDSIGVAKRVKM